MTETNRQPPSKLTPNAKRYVLRIQLRAELRERKLPNTAPLGRRRLYERILDDDFDVGEVVDATLAAVKGARFNGYEVSVTHDRLSVYLWEVD